MLQQHGYNTYMLGKWHLMPSEQESAAGPYDRWPLGRGFDRIGDLVPVFIEHGLTTLQEG